MSSGVALVLPLRHAAPGATVQREKTPHDEKALAFAWLAFGEVAPGRGGAHAGRRSTWAQWHCHSRGLWLISHVQLYVDLGDVYVCFHDRRVCLFSGSCTCTCKTPRRVQGPVLAQHRVRQGGVLPLAPRQGRVRIQVRRSGSMKRDTAVHAAEQESWQPGAVEEQAARAPVVEEDQEDELLQQHEEQQLSRPHRSRGAQPHDVVMTMSL